MSYRHLAHWISCKVCKAIYIYIRTGAYEPPKAAKEHTNASYRKIERATAVLSDGVVIIARVQSGLSVSMYLVVLVFALAARFNLYTLLAAHELLVQTIFSSFCPRAPELWHINFFLQNGSNLTHHT